MSLVQITFDSAFGTPIKITLSDNRRKQQSKYLPEELVKDFSVSLMKLVKGMDAGFCFLLELRKKFFWKYRLQIFGAWLI